MDKLISKYRESINPPYNWKDYFNLALTVLLLVALPATIFLSQQTQDIRNQAASGPFDYYGMSVQTFGVFGHKDFKSATRKSVTNRGAYHGAGVIVDTSSTPNKIYFADTGNSRILGFNGGDGTDKSADIVIGQPDMSSGNCNGDSNLGFKGAPTAGTLCLMSYPTGNNTAEQWGGQNLDVDSQGNLYVADRYNNRVLKYNQPFSADKTGGKGDGVADFVWGQDDFTSNGPNKGPFFGTINSPTATSLNFTSGHGNPTAAGVSVDPIDGGIWVGDFANHRVLHFPANSKTADMVLGKPNMTTRGCNETQQPSLNNMCSPIVARVDPESKDLYVIDIWPQGFQAKILEFRRGTDNRFQNGQTAVRFFKPNVPKLAGVNDWMFYPGTNDYIFKSSGFVFNKDKTNYPNGFMWINEHEKFRTLLIDKNGGVVAVLHAKDVYRIGRDTTYIGCDKNVNSGNRVAWPSGSIGQDSNNNLYFADEDNGRVVRYAAPYTTYQFNGTTCPPDGNASLLERRWNIFSVDSLGETNGIAVLGDQLIVADEGWTYKVWNDYKNKPFGSPADFVTSIGHPFGVPNSAGIDDSNRLWTKGEHHQLQVYQLPITSNSHAPIGDFIKLYWADDGTEITGGQIKALAFDQIKKKLYIAKGSRILRVSNYNDFPNKLLVDMVIGQTNKTNIACNQGLSSPNAGTICAVNQLKFDKLGNLYVVDDHYECRDSNRRITTFLANDLSSATGMFPNLQAKVVFIAPNFTTVNTFCAPDVVDFPGTPVTIAFNKRNQMVIGADGYYGNASQRELKQLWFYPNPLQKQTPDASIKLVMGTPGDMTFDDQDNFIIRDTTWYRVQMINLCTDPSWLEWLPGTTPVSACEVGGPVVTPTPTSQVSLPTPSTSAPTPTTTIPTPTRTPTPTTGVTDTISPTVSITSPLNNATVTRNSNLTMTATASDNIGVVRVEFYVNSSLRCPADTTAPYSCTYKLPGSPNATYTINARAYDAAGRVGNHTITVRATR